MGRARGGGRRRAGSGEGAFSSSAEPRSGLAKSQCWWGGLNPDLSYRTDSVFQIRAFLSLTEAPFRMTRSLVLPLHLERIHLGLRSYQYHCPRCFCLWWGGVTFGQNVQIT